MKRIFLIGLLACAATAAEPGIPTPSAAQMRQYTQQLDKLEKELFAEQKKDNQFGDRCWRDSKSLADQSGPAIIAAVMLRSRTWKDEIGLIFVPLIGLLPRKATLEVLHAYEKSSIASDRGWAKEMLIELDSDDVQEGVKKYSK